MFLFWGNRHTFVKKYIVSWNKENIQSGQASCCWSGGMNQSFCGSGKDLSNFLQKQARLVKLAAGASGIGQECLKVCMVGQDCLNE